MSKPGAKARKRGAGLLSMPMIVWTMVFVGLTIGYIVVLSFLERNPDGNGAVLRFTLDNYRKLFEENYARIFLNTLRLGFETTILCVLIGYPFGLLMARTKGRVRMLLMLLVMVPFWTNALVRLYGWRILLLGNGPLAVLINKVLMALQLIDAPIRFMNNHGAMLLGMTYGLLPFMILPTYASAEKMDRTLIEAGRDMGAKPWQVFLTVELRLTLPGLLAGCVLVFVPSLALFFVSDMMGGVNDLLIGNEIYNQLLKSHDWPFAAALSAVLLAVTALVMFVYRKAGGRSSDMRLF